MNTQELLTYYFKWQKAFFESVKVLFMKNNDLYFKLHLLKSTKEPVFVILSNSKKGDAKMYRMVRKIYDLAMNINKPVLIFDYPSYDVEVYTESKDSLFESDGK